MDKSVLGGLVALLALLASIIWLFVFIFGNLEMDMGSRGLFVAAAVFVGYVLCEYVNEFD